MLNRRFNINANIDNMQIVLMFNAILFLSFCATNAVAAEAMQIFAGIPPVAFLAEKIGGNRVKVDIMIRPGADPHTFEPAPKQIIALSRAKIFFTVGMPFENRLVEKISQSNPKLQIADTTPGIEKRRLEETDADSDHKTVHGYDDGFDPHIWLSPRSAKKMAANITDVLGKADPDGATFFRDNLKTLNEEFDAVDEKITEILKPYKDKPFYVFHPAFGYFGDCYGLKQKAIEAGGKQPSLKQLRSLILEAKAEGARAIFIQPQFDRRGAQVVAEAIGGKIVVLNDMEKNIPANLLDMAEKIGKSME